MIENCHLKLYFAVSLGQHSSFYQQYKQMMPEPLQSNPSVCIFYKIYAAFHLFELRREEITGVQDVIEHSLISNYVKKFIPFNINVQVIECVCSLKKTFQFFI